MNSTSSNSWPADVILWLAVPILAITPRDVPVLGAGERMVGIIAAMELGFLTKGFLNPSRLHLLEPIVLNRSCSPLTTTMARSLWPRSSLPTTKDLSKPAAQPKSYRLLGQLCLQNRPYYLGHRGRHLHSQGGTNNVIHIVTKNGWTL